MNKHATFSLLAILTMSSQLLFADSPGREDFISLQESVASLEDSLIQIQAEFQELYDFFDEKTDDNQAKLSNFNSLFSGVITNFPLKISEKNITISDDAVIYIGEQRLRDVIKSWIDIGGNSNVNMPDPASSSTNGNTRVVPPTYVTMEQFNALSDLVQSFGTYAYNTQQELQRVKTTLSAFKNGQSQTNAVFAAKLQKQSADVEDIQNGLDYERNYGLVRDYPSNLSIPAPDDLPEQYSSSGIASEFVAEETSRLKKVVLYCPSVSQLISPSSICITSPGLAWNKIVATGVNTNNMPYPEYSFGQPVISAGNTYYVCLESGTAYVCPRYRGYGILKIMEPLRTVPPPSLVSLSPFDSSNEIWSAIEFTGARISCDGDGINVDNGEIKIGGANVITATTIGASVRSELERTNGVFKESLTYEMFGTALRSALLTTSGGTINGALAIANANSNRPLTVNGSAVVTEETLTDAVESELANESGAFSGSLSYGMLSENLKSRLLTTAGGTVTGLLTVSNLTICNTGNWYVGTATRRSDIVLRHADSTIVAVGGNLTLAATNGVINIDSFASFNCDGQCGTVTVEFQNSTPAPVPIIAGVSENARAILTPRQDTPIRYWVTYAEGVLWLNFSDVSSQPLSFDYLVISK